MAKQLWTDDEDKKIRDGKAEGLSYEQIAEQLPGRTKAGVSLRAFTIGVAKSRDPKTNDTAAAGAAPAKKGRPKKAAAAVAAPAPAVATKTKGRPRKPAPEVVAAAPAAAPVAAKVRKPRTPKAAPAPVAAAPVVAAPKTNGTNGHRTAPTKGEQFIKLGGFSIGLPDNAQMEIVPGGVRYDLGNGLGITVSAAS